MRNKIVPRLIVDLILLTTFVLSQANLYTGNRFHEWNGTIMLLFIAIHIGINRHWFLAVFKGHYSFRRWLNLLINLTLAGIFIAVLWCAFFISRTVITFDSIEGSKRILFIHATLSCWLLVVAGMHVGLLWKRIHNWLCRLIPTISCDKYIKTIAISLTLPVGGGVYASFSREMASKLFMLPSENYYLPDQTVVTFCLLNLSIFSLYAILTYWLMRLVKEQFFRLS
ncbi:hypothetical protein [Desulfosediminicola flagellatus]|uniref:hypothetical protein n=1 Tax=Desulfosediminicola flagellatus TaxID=2569541 RepID=UPI0010ACB7C6|nr:hypothetical protein [Desulfosediminicola flagellatus]